MNKFFIEAGKNTPKINFDLDNGHFEISGKSFPENAGSFYKPVLDWVERFDPQPGSSVIIDFDFFYLSTSSIISVLEFLRLFKKLENKGNKITINWNYSEDDDDIKLTGEDLANLSELHFEFKTY